MVNPETLATFCKKPIHNTTQKKKITNIKPGINPDALEGK
jgi:hypothetical protein